MKVLILTDLEGVCGVNGRPDTIGNSIINKEASDRLLTAEVNAAAEGLLAAGATEVICWDGHGGSNSINIESLHQEVQLFQSGSPLDPVSILDASYDALVQLGAHAMSGVADGFLNHTFNSHAVVAMWLNGEPIGEIGVCACLAASVGVPTILVTGDRAACREARAFLGTVETAEVKIGIGRYSAVNKSPKKARDLIRAACQRALAAKDKFPIVRKEPPYTLRVELMCPNKADTAVKWGAKRVNHVTVEYTDNNFMHAYAMRNGYAPGVYEGIHGSR